MKKLLIVALTGFLFVGTGCVDEETPSSNDTNINAVVADDLTLAPDDADTVTITNVSSNVAGHLVIHVDNAGSPGDVIGNTSVSDGQNPNVEVTLSRPAVDGETLYAMLHIDSPEDGEYTFGENPEEDVPATDADGNVVVDPFTITIESDEIVPSVTVSDQTADPANMVTIDSVTAAVPGYIVIHEFDEDGELVVAPELGVASVPTGTTDDIEVTLNRDLRDGETVAAMLHSEDNENDTYDGAGTDAPVTDANGDVITPSFSVTVAALTPGVTVMDQMVDPADEVVIAEVVAAVDGYIVIHEFDENGELVVAPELGATAVSAGTNTDVIVSLNRPAEDGEMLAAMLHSEDNDNDSYDGAGTDAPVTDANGDVITPTFITSLSPVASVSVDDQTADPANMVVVAEVFAERAGYIVIHDEDENGDLIVAPEVGVAPVAEGLNTDVMVTLNRPVYSGETLYAMLHTEDGGDANAYDGAGTDAPVTDSNGDIITPPFIATAAATEPFVTVMDQLADPADTVTVRQVLYDSAGWIVIHESDSNGMPGAVLGQTEVAAGVNQNLDVNLSRNIVSGETLFAMLHTDDGDGVYEFPGPDGPVTDSNGDVVTPSFVATTPENMVNVMDQTLGTVSTSVSIDSAYALRDGYIVIHEDDNGAIGPVIGIAAIDPGANGQLDITLDRPAVDGETLYAMLHTEDGGDPAAYDGAATDLPANDSNGDVVAPAFVVTVPAGTPAIVLTVNSQGNSGYLFASATPADYFDDVVGGSATTENPDLTLREGWRYSFELGSTAGAHPIQFGTNGLTPLGDDWKLVQGNGGDNTFELNSDINWVDAGGTVTFTVTQDVADDAPDYQCQVHGGMLGEISYVTP